jgi:hypothetical protein
MEFVSNNLLFYDICAYVQGNLLVCNVHQRPSALGLMDYVAMLSAIR